MAPLRILSASALAFACVLVLCRAQASAASQNYVTLLFSRGLVQGVMPPGCTPLPGGVTVWQVADYLGQKGYTATEAATTTTTAQSSRCNANGDYTLGWDDLHTLRDQYGWEATPRATRDDRALSLDEQYADSCNLLRTFYAEGFDRAWSMYSYYGGQYSLSMQRDVVGTCFAFGRTYQGTVNPLPLTFPYLVSVESINGGRCADRALPCSTLGTRFTYTQPSEIQALVNQNGWAVVQGYKFVTGRFSAGGWGWDCTGLDPASHWTTKTELYCYGDWQSAIEAIPPATQVAAADVVAAAQGRVMRGPVTAIRLTPSSGVIQTGTSQPFTVDGLDAQGRFAGEVTSETTLAVDGGGWCTANACGASMPGVYTVTATHAGTGATATALMTVTDGPAVTGVSPTSGKVGSSVTITGIAIGGATGVAFGGAPAAFTVQSPSRITATVPAAATTGAITVTTASGSATSAGAYSVLPAITSVSPGNGPVGRLVTITGSGLGGATSVRFNRVGAVFTVLSSTRITARVPWRGTTGAITVTTPGGTATSQSAFRVVPGIASFSPAQGPGGTLVTISGSAFTGATRVAFGGVAASFAVSSNTAITASVPTGATTGRITVRTSGGTATSASTFVVTAAPALPAGRLLRFVA
jgi:hypothetical protein